MRPNTIKALVLLLSLLLLVIYGGSIFLLVSHHIKTDLTLSYLSGKMLNAHVPGYHFSKEYLLSKQVKIDIIPNLSPPFNVMLTALAAKCLSYKQFFVIFMVTSISLNVFALTRLYQHFYPQKNAYQRLLACAFVLANFIFMPTFLNISFGQMALLLNILVIFSYLALEQKKEILAGFLLAFAANIKLFFGIFAIYFIAQKRYYAFFSLIIFCLLFAIIPLLIYGSSIYTGYFKTLTAVSWYGINWNASIYGFLCRVTGDPNHRFLSLVSFPMITKLAYYAIFSAYIATVYFFSQKNRHTSALGFALTLSTMLLISPLGWNYYFPLLITAFLIVLNAAKSNRLYPLLICLMLFSLFLSALPFPMYTDSKTTTFNLITQGNNFFLALLLFNLCTISQLRLAKEKNSSPLFFSTKLKIFLFSMCLLPSFIGLCCITQHSFTYTNTDIEHAIEQPSTTD